MAKASAISVTAFRPSRLPRVARPAWHLPLISPSDLAPQAPPRVSSLLSPARS